MPRPGMMLLLPPSEGKASGGTQPVWQPGCGAFGTMLGPRRLDVVEALAAVGGGDARLLGVRGAHLERAQDANRRLLVSPTLPASARYTGVVWEHLDLASLPAAVRRRANTRVAVVSGLLGLTLISDPIPDYRLAMGARLAPLGTLSSWWRDAVTEALARWAHRQVVVDLLPNEHRSAWRPDAGQFADIIRVDLVESTESGQTRVVGHHAKAAKGQLARHLLLSGGDPRRALASWQHPHLSLRYQ